MTAPAPTVERMSRHRAAVPHVCSRPPAGRRQLAELGATLAPAVLLTVALSLALALASCAP